MSLPFGPPLEPMLARAAPEIPREGHWLYEPKWDGFRAIVFRDGERVHIASRNALALERYFPELIQPLREALPERSIVDGEVVIATEHGLDFDALQQRIHPAATRVRMLSEKTPASVVLFDLLALGGDDLRERPLEQRRQALVAAIASSPIVGVTPQTTDPDQATTWFTRYEGAGLDGVVAKDPAGPYRPGERRWIKVKHLRTVDCVVGGYRIAKDGRGIGSLLLGLYDGDGALHHVGHTSSFDAAERRAILEQLQPLVGGGSFGQGRTPGGPSRWQRSADSAWTPVRPDLVCEVSFDHLQSGRFRHASRFLRWRPDKAPRSCDFDQLSPPEAFSLDDILVTRGS
ncbi:MAG TPA: ATP-dependent DNA ligase [Candidatus Saccharimonadales bacterium]|nr:ATP-dependent DNA ligase [Candidatus Saccharimonadales bacterium]